ncbi:MAG: cupin domain-containing protein [Caulobacteraceae bacterium]
MPLDGFLDETLGRGVAKVGGEGESYRAGLLGAEPERTVLEAYSYLSGKIGFHAEEPLGPPPAVEAVADVHAFRTKIQSFHARGYTVRLPDMRWVSPALDEFCRALEFVLHQPVKAEAFWSRGDAKAPAHHDDYDIIVIQLRGRKRWFISANRSDLPNAWKAIPLASPPPDRFQEVEVCPGDLLYLPRGTRHRVDALSDSLHISIGFVPLTLRDALIAAVDHLSDLDRTLRETADGRLGVTVRQDDFAHLAPRIRQGVASLLAQCGSEDFISTAMQRRSSRTVAALDKLPSSAYRPQITGELMLRHSPRAMCHLMANSEKIDFSLPGEHLYIHRGVEESVKFISETPEFRVRDIPGGVADDIRFALVDKFLTSGFLEVVR